MFAYVFLCWFLYSCAVFSCMYASPKHHTCFVLPYFNAVEQRGAYMDSLNHITIVSICHVNSLGLI